MDSLAWCYIVFVSACHTWLTRAADPITWTLTRDYPHDVSFDKSGIFYTLYTDNKRVPWSAAGDHCRSQYGTTSALYQPRDRAEMAHVTQDWLQGQLRERGVTAVSVWTGLTRSESAWTWLSGSEDLSLLGDRWSGDTSGTQGGACAVWDVMEDTWRQEECGASNHVLCKSVNHYREQYNSPGFDAMAALVVDNKNHSEAHEECGHYGYELLTVTSEEGAGFMSALCSRMKRVTSFPVPVLFWVDSGRDHSCAVWDSALDAVKEVQCGLRLSYTCSYRHLMSPAHAVSLSRSPSPRRHSIHKRSTVGLTPAEADSGAPAEAPGSRVIGLVTIGVISTIGIIILLSDIPTLYSHAKNAVLNMCGFCGHCREEGPAGVDPRAATGGTTGRVQPAAGRPPARRQPTETARPARPATETARLARPADGKPPATGITRPPARRPAAGPSKPPATGAAKPLITGAAKQPARRS